MPYKFLSIPLLTEQHIQKCKDFCYWYRKSAEANRLKRIKNWMFSHEKMFVVEPHAN